MNCGLAAIQQKSGQTGRSIEYRQSLSAKSSEMEENLTPVPRQEVLAIMKAVQESAVFGTTNSDIAEARKILRR